MRMRYHPHVILYPVANYYIKFKFDDGIRVAKTEIRQRVILQVSISEAYIDMLKKDVTRFYMAYDDNGNVSISDSAL